MSQQPITPEAVQQAMADQVRHVVDAIMGTGVNLEVEVEDNIVTAPVSSLIEGDVLIGEAGGTSIVRHVVANIVLVQTEHGALYLDSNDEVAVVQR